MLGFKTFLCAQILLGGIEAHDRKTPDDRWRCPEALSCRSVLFSGNLCHPLYIAFFRPDFLTATEPTNFLLILFTAALAVVTFLMWLFTRALFKEMQRSGKTAEISDNAAEKSALAAETSANVSRVSVEAAIAAQPPRWSFVRPVDLKHVLG